MNNVPYRLSSFLPAVRKIDQNKPNPQHAKGGASFKSSTVISLIFCALKLPLNFLDVEHWDSNLQTTAFPLITHYPFCWCCCIRKIRRNHIISSCIKRKRIATNSTNPYFVLATFRTCFFSPFSTFNDEKSHKDYNERITIRDNGNVQTHKKKESKSNSTINENSGAHILTHDQIIKKSNQWE